LILNQDLTPIKINPTPRKIHTIFIYDIFSTIPNKPIEVVKINIRGPIRARELLTTRAFSTELNFNIKIAAKSSILPDKNLKKAMANTAFSNIINIITS
jgi:hypothetical protein